MNTASVLPDYLNDAQAAAIAGVFSDFEIHPLTCLFWRADIRILINKNRRIADDLIFIPKSRALLCTVGDETRVLQPGEFMMVAAGTPHAVAVPDGGPSQQFGMHLHLLDGGGNRVIDRLGSPFGVMPDPGQWFRQLSICTHLMGRGGCGGESCFKTLVQLILCEQFSHGALLREMPRRMHPRIQVLIGEIQAQCARDWTVADMARGCGMSVSNFRKHFVSGTGGPPKKFVQRIRLTQARSLLATRPDLAVEEVAARVGIPEAHYFHAIYKDMFGETPRKRRRVEALEC